MNTNNPTIIPEASSVSLLSNLLTGPVLILWVTGSFYDCNIETLSVDTRKNTIVTSYCVGNGYYILWWPNYGLPVYPEKQEVLGVI